MWIGLFLFSRFFLCGFFNEQWILCPWRTPLPHVGNQIGYGAWEAMGTHCYGQSNSNSNVTNFFRLIRRIHTIPHQHLKNQSIQSHSVHTCTPTPHALLHLCSHPLFTPYTHHTLRTQNTRAHHVTSPISLIHLTAQQHSQRSPSQLPEIRCGSLRFHTAPIQKVTPLHKQCTDGYERPTGPRVLRKSGHRFKIKQQKNRFIL